MSEPSKKEATYEDLSSVPENMTGEIIDGELVVLPRRPRRHGYVASALGAEIVVPYQFGRGGGPGGWVFIDEPEIQLGKHTLVPDLAGWKRERFPVEEDQNQISVVPDWVCEILSPTTALRDRTSKIRIYAEHTIPFLWLLDPIVAILEAYKLESGRWSLLGAYGGAEKMRVEPFQEIEIDLADLWLEATTAPR